MLWWWVYAIEEEEVNSVVRKVVGAAGVGYVERTMLLGLDGMVVVLEWVLVL